MKQDINSQRQKHKWRVRRYSKAKVKRGIGYGANQETEAQSATVY